MFGLLPDEWMQNLSQLGVQPFGGSGILDMAMNQQNPVINAAANAPTTGADTAGGGWAMNPDKLKAMGKLFSSMGGMAALNQRAQMPPATPPQQPQMQAPAMGGTPRPMAQPPQAQMTPPGMPPMMTGNPGAGAPGGAGMGGQFGVGPMGGMVPGDMLRRRLMGMMG